MIEKRNFMHIFLKFRFGFVG